MNEQKYLKIENAGLLEKDALTLIGASSKRNDNNKIGQFGSGNKYALAFLLRNGYEPKIFSGLDEIKITTNKTIFREVEFEVIYIDDNKTSITTQMGKDWKLWQALREIYSNALDEGEAKIQLVDNISPLRNKTQFYLKLDDHIKEFVDQFDKYFSERKVVLFECRFGKILEKAPGKTNIYRKGIRCLDWDRKSYFDYDLPNLDIDEDRLIKYHWQVEEEIWKVLFSCNDKKIIKKVLTELPNDSYIESALSDISDFDKKYLSKEFREILSEGQVAPQNLSGLLDLEESQKVFILPNKIFNAIRPELDEKSVDEKFRIGSNNILYMNINPIPPLYQATINRAKEFFKECDFEIPYEIIVGKFDKKEYHGLADGKSIVISDICIEKGVNWVVNTIIEEFIHIKYSVGDKTRAFQDSVIYEFITYMKKQTAFVL